MLQVDFEQVLRRRIETARLIETWPSLSRQELSRQEFIDHPMDA